MKTKICKIHGELTAEQINIYTRKNVAQERCNICCIAAKKRYNQTEKGKATNKRYRQTEKCKTTKKIYNQSEERKAVKKIYSQSQEGKAVTKRYRESEKFKRSLEKRRQRSETEKEKDRIRNRASSKKCNEKQRNDLVDKYVKRLLISNMKVKIDNIDPKLLDLKRILLKIKRKIREKKGS